MNDDRKNDESLPERVKVDPWTVNVRRNQAGNLAIEVDIDGVRRAELILQEGGTTDLLTTARRQMDLGEKGWQTPGKPEGLRRFRFEPEE